jgi:hypothetical protein
MVAAVGSTLLPLPSGEAHRPYRLRGGVSRVQFSF